MSDFLNKLKEILIQAMPLFLAKFMPAAVDFIVQKAAESSNKIDDALVEAIKNAVNDNADTE